MINRLVVAALAAEVLLAPVAMGQAVRDPDFGPNVRIFGPSTSIDSIQAALDTAFAVQESSEFGPGRYAFLFKRGSYDLVAHVGFHTQVAGLGLSPEDVVVNGAVIADAQWKKGNATQNFWRIAENMRVNAPAPDHTEQWAVSQAAPMRRMHIVGDLRLDDGGWSSGGFLADARVSASVRSGSQQQWLTRGSEIGGWKGANWNMVFVGVAGAPGNSFPEPPYTTLPSMPVIREKPFLYVDTLGAWSVFVPALRRNATGVTWGSGAPAGVSYPIESFFIAKPGATAATMNAALASGQQLIITPGIYHLDAPLRITHTNTVVLGLGLATLVADNGTTAIDIADVDGVTVAGLLIDAGPTNSPLLMRVGPRDARARHAANPTLLSDLFFRIGGVGPARASRTLEINSNDVIGDHMWLWRADHGNGVGWTTNTAADGLVVNGSDVTMYGLFVEHFQQHEVLWNGERGRTFMFQNEMPYDVPTQAAWMDGTTRGFAAYEVARGVKSHEAWGLGSYCFFNRNPSLVADRAFRVPVTPGVRLHNMVTVSLGGGKGTIAHVVNSTGPAATKGASVQKLVSGP
ncbi:MAG: coagulation factor 5/8 type domain-containing protein [bacterium]